MKVIDIIFAIIAGKFIGFLAGDFLKEWGIDIGFVGWIILWIIVPLFSLFFLWLSYIIGKRLLFIFQAAKFLLVGASATIIDLQIFEFLIFIQSNKIFWTFGVVSILSFMPLASKGISFLVATFIKYWGNKYWAFQKTDAGQLNNQEKIGWLKEIIQFFGITIVGLIIDIVSFYYFIEIMGPQISMAPAIWIKLSVIFAAATAALWNFIGYKFFVFKN